MRFITTKLHGFADYIVGSVVMALPFYFGLLGRPRIVFIALGATVIVYSALTDYELGLIRFLRVRFHLLLDTLFGATMLLIPSLIRIPPNVKAPVYVIGILAILLAVTTKIRASGTHAEGSLQ